MDIFRITIREKKGQIWPVVVKHEPRGSVSKVQYDGALKLPTDYEIRLRKALLKPKAYGEILGKALFTVDLREAFVTARGSGRGKLRVILRIDDASLQHLHWQRLCFYQNGEWRFIAHDQQTPFSLTWPVRDPWHKYPLINLYFPVSDM